MPYDDQNVFAKILRGELPCTKVHETDHALAFQDIAPQAAVHVLVIPKGAYVSLDDFTAGAGPGVVGHFFKVVGDDIAAAAAAMQNLAPHPSPQEEDPPLRQLERSTHTTRRRNTRSRELTTRIHTRDAILQDNSSLQLQLRRRRG